MIHRGERTAVGSFGCQFSEPPPRRIHPELCKVVAGVENEAVSSLARRRFVIGADASSRRGVKNRMRLGGAAEVCNRCRAFWGAPGIIASTTPPSDKGWWAGTRQQAGRVLLSIRTLPDLAALDCRKLTDQQISLLDETFEDFALRPLLPTNEAWSDQTRRELDEAVHRRRRQHRGLEWHDQTRRELDEAVLCDTLRLHTAADTDRAELLESLTVSR